MDIQIDASLFFALPLLVINYFIATLMETNRPPFDLSEAESDVVAGYIVEYSGIIFGLFYLGEYVNIFSNSFFILLLFSNYIFNMIVYLKKFLNFFYNFIFLFYY
jgi:NADH:ubiquinone oxidoreductase subunit H